MLSLTDCAGTRIDIPAAPGQKLSEAIWLSGQIEPVPLCGGIGLCGNCRVRYLSAPPPPCEQEIKFFSEQDLESGWRLACRHHIPDQSDVSIELAARVLPDEVPPHPVRPLKEVALGIDLGTTSVQWRAVKPGEVHVILDSGSFLNPQAGAGADIISRLAYADTPAGLSHLSWLGRKAIAKIVSYLMKSGFRPEKSCIAANSAMTEILLEQDISGLIAAPYSLSFRGGATVPLTLPGFTASLSVLIPPLPGPFVGADISAGLLALIEAKMPRPFILADFGTNAEIALLDSESNLWLASAPLGPALEGIGPACGQAAGPGVITGFSIDPAGLRPQYFDGPYPEEVKGISATGYFSLLAILYRIGVMDASGQFTSSSPVMPLARKIAASIKDGIIVLPHDLFLSADDVEQLLKVRAAIAITFRALLQAAGVSANEVCGLWLAGALGKFSNPDDLGILGILPQTLADKTHICGNTSLKGACLLACYPRKEAYLENLCAGARILQMAAAPDFLHDYVAAMAWGPYAV